MYLFQPRPIKLLPGLNMALLNELSVNLSGEINYYGKRQLITLHSDTFKVLIYCESATTISITMVWRKFSIEKFLTFEPGINVFCLCSLFPLTDLALQRRLEPRLQFRLVILQDILDFYNTEEIFPHLANGTGKPCNRFLTRVPTFGLFNSSVECLYTSDIPLSDRYKPCRLQDYCIKTIALCGFSSSYISDRIGKTMVDLSMVALSEVKKSVLNCCHPDIP